MTDKIIYELLLRNHYAGWAELHKKYFDKKYFPSIIKKNSSWVNWRYFYNGTHEEVWSDAIRLLAHRVHQGKFVPKTLEGDFFIAGLMGFTWRCWQEVFRKNPLFDDIEMQVPSIPDAYLYDVPDHDDWDMLLLNIYVEQLSDMDKHIMLLKYFPETPEEANLADREIVQKLEIMGFKSISREEVGVRRLRAIRKCTKLYKKLPKSKSIVEAALKKEEKIDYALINIGYPVGELYGILYNSGERFPEKERLSAIKECLDATQISRELESRDRLRIYKSDLVQWMNRMESLYAEWSMESIGKILKAFIHDFRGLFLK